MSPALALPFQSSGASGDIKVKAGPRIWTDIRGEVRTMLAVVVVAVVVAVVAVVVVVVVVVVLLLLLLLTLFSSRLLQESGHVHVAQESIFNTSIQGAKQGL